MSSAAVVDFAELERKPQEEQHMQLREVLMVPWRSAHRGLRWLSLIITMACVLGAIVAGWFMHNRHWWLLSTGIYCLGALYAWAFWLSTSLLLAIDARRLRLPGVQRAAQGSVLLYGFLTVAVPTLVLGALGANASVVALLTALAVTGSLAFVLLPRWLSMWFGFLPALNIGLRHLVQYPPMSDPRWLAWGTLALAVLLVVDVLRWRHLLRNETDNELGYGSAMVMQFRRQGALGNWSGLQQFDSGLMVRQRPNWMQPRADLRRTGPQYAVRALRVALGGWYTPQTVAGHLRAATLALLPILVMIPVMMLISTENHHREGLLIGFGAGLGWCITFVGLMLTAMTTVLIRQRWQRSNAELPLLALLPGLGDARHVRGNLLRAALVIPVVTQLMLLIAILAAALFAAPFIHLGGLALLLVTLPQLGALGATVAQVLCTLGGRKLPTWGEWLVFAPLVVLFFASSFIPLTTLGQHPWAGDSLMEPLMLAAWVVMALMLAWVGRRGWRGMLARPHPFLPN